MNRGETLCQVCRITAAEILQHAARAKQQDVVLLLLSFIAHPHRSGAIRSLSMTGSTSETPGLINRAETLLLLLFFLSGMLG